MKKLFKIPDKEKNYQSYMVYALTIIWTVVTVLTVSMGFYFFSDLWQRWLLFVFVSLFIAAFNLTLNRLGYVRVASWSLSTMLWLFITIPCFSAGGIMATGILSQMSVIVTAGFLLGWRGGLTIGLLSIGTDFWMVHLQLTGSLPVPTVIHTPVTRWIAATIPFGTILALQYYATNHLRSSLIRMQKEIVNREVAEKLKDDTVYQLKERVKELKTLYEVSRILQIEDAPTEHLCRELAELVPAGWQYPLNTAARVSIGNTHYHTSNYKPSEYFQLAEMKTTKGTRVAIEIVYLNAMPEQDEGPFLKEERSLITMLVEMLKIDWEGRERRAELKDYKYALDIASLVSISRVDGSFTFVNENFCAISKYSSEELLGKNHTVLWSGTHSKLYLKNLRTDLLDGKPFRGEFLNRAKDDSFFWVDTTIVPFLDESGKVYQYLSINYDITNRKNAETELKESEEKFRSLVEQTLVGVFILQEDQFKYVNPGFEKMTGYPKEKLLNDITLDYLMHDDDADRIRKEYLLADKDTHPNQEIFKAIKKDGEVIYVEAIISEIIYKNKPALIGTLVDITGRMEEEKRISKAVIDAQENERLQIGMELHDNVKQILAAANLMLEIALNKIEDQKTTVQIINDVKGYIIEGVNEIRRLSHQLAPSADDSVPLAEKIRSLVKNMNAGNLLSIHIYADELGLTVNREIPLTFYRILQEQLNNIIKYAEATLAEITISNNEGKAILSIKDNGKGFDMNELKTGIGLQNIKRRVQVLGGLVKIISSPGNGCEIIAEIPFK